MRLEALLRRHAKAPDAEPSARKAQVRSALEALVATMQANQ